jgi:hypothetical protein
MMLYEVKRTAAAVADVLRADEPAEPAESVDDGAQEAFDALAAMEPVAVNGYAADGTTSSWA